MDGLGSDKMHDIDWHEANYQALLRSDADDSKRMEALEALLEEQYVERYMTEYAAVCLRNGREREAQRILKKQLFLFPGGPFEELAERLTEEGESAAERVLETLKNEPSSEVLPQPDGVVTPAIADTPAFTGETGGAKGASCDPALPEAVARCFERVVGMEGAKKVMLDLYTAMQYQAARAGYDLKTQRHHHFLIRGDIGGGKTLLAERVCNFLHEMGVASEAAPCVLEDYRLGDVLGTDGSGLEEALDACEGRNVVVDGISTLFENADNRGGNRPLLFRTVLERYSDKVNFLLCGTKKDIDHLLTLEPSLSGWFLYDIELPAYSPEELLEMAVIIAKDRGYTLSTGAKTALLEQFENEYRSPTFQSGKTLEGIIGRASLRLAGRVASLGPASKGKLMRIESEDLDDVSETLRLDELMAQLDGLTGLSSVKEEVRRLTALARVNREAKRMGQPSAGFGTLHMVFAGNPGTGKTTVARIIGSIYRALGILPQGDKLVECGRSDLVAEFVGQTAPKVKAKVAEAMGGVLFIDEAYDLCADNDSFGQEAVNTLVAEIENHRADLMVILAGYTEDMDKFLTRNPGLSSRFPNRLEFPDYSQKEMEAIFHGMLTSANKRLDQGCEELLTVYIEENRTKRDFGNARGIRNLRDDLIASQALRLNTQMEQGAILTPQDFALITARDFDSLVEDDGKRKTLTEWLEELNSLTGLSSVKEQVRQLAALARTNAEAKRMGLPSAGFGTLHMIFTGNAGTGKTTVARIIGGIYRALGILPEGDRVVECTRADLVAEYAGQTAPKVKGKVKEALGGVLFIDEAYDLCTDGGSFGQEAVNTLVSEIENHRNDLMVILAGYTKDMDKFLDSNQGLASRFPNRIEFPDYSQAEMEEIFLGMLNGAGRQLDEGCEGLLKSYIAENRTKRGFGNARGIRNLRDKLIAAQGLRLNQRIEQGEALEAQNVALITAQDFEKLVENRGDKKGLEDWLAELDALTGLASVKEQVRRKVNTVLGQQKMKETGVLQSFDPGTMHMVFKGNAGTGKTTVARIIAGIYNCLGLLPDGDTFVECTRADLVAEYVGQTAPKVKSVIQQAMGGVLFIDEAYSLCRDANDTFGREAVDALIADMENHRKELMVILGGYTEDMEQFFSFNQGMASRVPTSMVFEDYAPDELFQIFQNIIKGKNFVLSDGALAPARELIEAQAKKPGFGNARGVRNIAEGIIERHTAAVGERVAKGETLDEAEYLTIQPSEIETA